MGKSPEEILQSASRSGATETERQEMLSLFHQENLEFRVKGKLTDVLENSNDTEKEELNLKDLFERIWDRILQKEKEKKGQTFRFNTWMKVAAALVLGVIIGSLVFNKPEKT